MKKLIRVRKTLSPLQPSMMLTMAFWLRRNWILGLLGNCMVLAFVKQYLRACAVKLVRGSAWFG